MALTKVDCSQAKSKVHHCRFIVRLVRDLDASLHPSIMRQLILKGLDWANDRDKSIMTPLGNELILKMYELSHETFKAALHTLPSSDRIDILAVLQITHTDILNLHEEESMDDFHECEQALVESEEEYGEDSLVLDVPETTTRQLMVPETTTEYSTTTHTRTTQPVPETSSPVQTAAVDSNNWFTYPMDGLASLSNSIEVHTLEQVISTLTSGNNASRGVSIPALRRLIPLAQEESCEEWNRVFNQVMFILLDLAFDKERTSGSLSLEIHALEVLQRVLYHQKDLAGENIKVLYNRLLHGCNSSTALIADKAEKILRTEMVSSFPLQSIDCLTALIGSDRLSSPSLQAALRLLNETLRILRGNDHVVQHLERLNYILTRSFENSCSIVRMSVVNCWVALIVYWPLEFQPYFRKLDIGRQKLVTIYVERDRIAAITGSETHKVSTRAIPSAFTPNALAA